jgi:exodeoxyribonuclease V gamma subunit
LRVRFDGVEEAQRELEPFSLNGLEKYQVGQLLLSAKDSTAALSELKLSGSLPIAAFGEREAVKFQNDLDVVVERQVAWRQRFTSEAPALSIALNVNGISLTGTLNGLWSAHDSTSSTQSPAAVSPCLQISQRLGAVLEGSDEDQTARGHIVAGMWVNHLAACASGIPMSTVQLGLDGQAVFAPMGPEEAMVILQRLTNAYMQAWKRPLPAACKTAWAYLQAKTKAERIEAEQPEKVKDPHEVAQGVFEGGFMRDSELTASAYLARAFESYQDIESELPHWAQELYGDMAFQVRLYDEQEMQA